MSLFEQDFIPTSNKYFIGIDNGVTGTIAIIKPSGETYFNHIPTKKEQSYTKARQSISRIDFNKLKSILKNHIPEIIPQSEYRMAMDNFVVYHGESDESISARLKEHRAKYESLSDEFKLPVHVVIERPMLNPGRLKSSVSALRSLEAVLIVIDDVLHYPFSYVDSRAWQKLLLPSGLQKEELKKASLDIGNRLFPQFRDFKHPDRDGLLIAEYARRTNL